MQKQTKPKITIRYIEQSLPDDFPIVFYKRRPSFTNSTRLHFHNGIEIGYCYEGSGLFFVYDQIIPYSAGDIVILLPDQPHVAQASRSSPSDWHFLTVDATQMFRDAPAALVQLLPDLLEHRLLIPIVIHKEKREQLCSLIKEIFYELSVMQDRYKPVVYAMLMSFFLKLARLGKPDQKNEPEKDHYFNYAEIVPAIEFISANYMQEITVQTLAQLCYLSERHFSRLFKRVMGRTPNEYIIQVRIRMASTLMKTTSQTISDIALDVGYQSISTFNRNFRTVKGMTPKEYRKNH